MKGTVVGAFPEPFFGRSDKPIHKILYSAAHVPVEGC